MIQPSIHRFDTVGSTNDVALEMVKLGAHEGTVVIAKEQTKGRGRRGRIWLDEPGHSILMSIVLSPNKRLDELPQLSFVASLSVADALRKLGVNPLLKWPNDVYVQGKKISGILLEITFCDNHPVIVIGMGVNINQTSFSSDIAEIATSVAIETKTQTDLDIAADMLIDAIFTNYDAYLAEGLEEILSQWTKYMWGIGSIAEVITEGRKIQGKIIGLDKSGALVLKDADGSMHNIHAADAVNMRKTV